MNVLLPCAQCGKTNARRICPSSHPVRSFCDRQCKGAWQREQKPATKEWLYQKYIVEGLDANAIARIVGRDGKRVWEWLRDYGIATRKRGGASSPGSFRRGDISPFTGRKHTPETREALRQARLRDGHVPYLKDGQHYLKGKTGAATPSWKGGITPERQAFYSTPEWREAVKAVWKRADARCERCGKHHNECATRGTFAIHHIVSFAVREKRAEPTNLALLCKGCHLFVHSRKNTGKELIG